LKSVDKDEELREESNHCLDTGREGGENGNEVKNSRKLTKTERKQNMPIDGRKTKIIIENKAKQNSQTRGRVQREREIGNK